MSLEYTNDTPIPSKSSVLPQFSGEHRLLGQHVSQNMISQDPLLPTYSNAIPQNLTTTVQKSSTLLVQSSGDTAPITPASSMSYSSPPLSPTGTMSKHKMIECRGGRIDLDDCTDISPLQCGSIKPDPNYDPTSDPQFKQFVPPEEIIVRIKQEVPEWLRLDKPTLDRRRSTPIFRPSNDLLRRQTSCRSRLQESSMENMYVVDGKTVTLSPRRHARKLSGQISIGSIVGQSSLHTSPTESCSSDDESRKLDMVPERKSFVKREFKYFLGKVAPLFKRGDHIDLQRSRGCLT